MFLVDRHALMRRAAAEWINRCSGLIVCGLAGRIARASEEINHLQPDIVVTELMQPHDLGFIRKLRRQHPRLPILIFTLEEEALYGKQAEAAGASGYLMKEAGGEKLVQTIQALLGRSSGGRAGLLPQEWREGQGGAGSRRGDASSSGLWRCAATLSPFPSAADRR